MSRELDLTALDNFSLKPYPVMTATTSSHQAIYPSQDNGMGAIKAAAVAFGLEWLSALIPIVIIFILSVCCYTKKKKSKSSQTDQTTEMAEVRPEPDGQTQEQVGVENLVINIEQSDPVKKDFILVVDEF